MKNILILFTLLMAFSTALQGQYTSGWQNESFLHQTVNPALVGTADEFSVAVQYARRWDRLSSSPTDINALATMPFAEKNMALGIWINRSKVGPLTHSGVGLQYGYSFPLGLAADDQLTLGLAVRVLGTQLDQSSFVAADGADPLLTGSDYRAHVPPHANIGFAYSSGEVSFQQPYVVEVAGSFARYIPFSDRFNTLQFDRLHQWYAMAGLTSYIDEDVSLTTSVLSSSIGQDQVQTAARLSLEHKSFGWLTLQYGNRKQFLTQAGINLDVNSRFDDRIQLVGTYGWHFGTVGSQLGNGISFGIAYYRSLQ